MDTTIVASTALAGVGFAVVLEALYRLFFSVRVNVSVGNSILVKTLTDNNVGRVKKLATAAPRGSYFGPIGKAIDAGLPLTGRDAVTIAAATHPAFETAATATERAWRRVAERGQLGAIIAIGGFALEAQDGIRTPAVMTLFGLAVLGGIWHTVHKGDMAKALAAARDEVLPALDRALSVPVADEVS